MRLSKFIRENETRVMDEWTTHAGSLYAAENFHSKTWNDWACEMLRLIAADLESSRERDVASGLATSVAGESANANSLPSSDRGIDSVLAGFQALRASVIRLWCDAGNLLEQEDVIRFNRAVDHALARMIRAYAKQEKYQARLLQAALACSSEQSCVLDREGRVLYANSAMANSYGMRPQDIEGTRVADLDPEFAEEVEQQIDAVTSTGRATCGDFTMSTSQGDVHVIETMFAPILDDNGVVDAIAVNSRDITERKSWERALWKHANHDHVTGVPNRRLLMDRLEQDIRMTRRNRGLLALLYIDLDSFKEASDRLGYEAGDELLQQVAERIASCIRETDTVARMGGDEFTVILMDAGDRRRVEAVARAILTRLSRPYTVRDEIAHVGASIGIGLYPEHGESVDDLLTSSDRAMYAAKQAGGDRVSFFAAEDPAQMRGRARTVEQRQRQH